jgi:hypothetical protein
MLKLSLLILITLTDLPAQTGEAPLSTGAKARYSVSSSVGPAALVEMAAYAGVLQALPTPLEWRQGAAGYGERFASATSANAIRQAFAFALEVPLNEDPRYFRAQRRGVWPRLGHALAATVVTRTDAGHRRFAFSGVTSAYGAAFLSNQWYPDRLNTVGQGFLQGTATLGLDALGNIVTEFWPKRRRKLQRTDGNPPAAAAYATVQ